MNEVNSFIDQADLKSLLETINSANNSDQSEEFITKENVDKYVKENQNFTYINNSCVLIYIILKYISKKPETIQDMSVINNAFVTYCKRNNVSFKSLINQSTLSILDASNKKSQTWLKFEILLKKLIKDRIYNPKNLAKELLDFIKLDTETSIQVRLASCIQACLSECREANKADGEDDFEDKWMEIIEWMSWFLNSEDEFSV